MNIFEQISFIYFEKDRSEGLKNSFAISLQNSFFHKKTKLEMLYFSDKVRQNATSGSWRFKLYK